MNIENNLRNIIITDNKKDMDNTYKIFLESIINDNKNFVNNRKEEEKEYSNNYKKILDREDKNINFVPECISKKSPITIINGPWGSGKTYFIENFGKFLFKNNKDDINMIILDVWKYSASKNIIEDFFKNLGEELKKLNSKNLKKNLYILKKMANKNIGNLIDSLEISFKWVKLKVYFKAKEKEHFNSIKNSEKSLTMIFLDNIERLGKNYWEIIKAINILSMIEDFIFILPLNVKNILNINKNNNYGEYPIEKYIDIPGYNLTQDYSSILNNLGIKGNKKKFLNILLKQINKKNKKECMSIRNIKMIINSNKINKIKDDISFLKEVNKKINLSKIKILPIEFLFPEFDDFQKIQNDKYSLYQSIQNKILDIYNTHSNHMSGPIGGEMKTLYQRFIESNEILNYFMKKQFFEIKIDIIKKLFNDLKNKEIDNNYNIYEILNFKEKIDSILKKEEEFIIKYKNEKKIYDFLKNNADNYTVNNIWEKFLNFIL